MQSIYPIRFFSQSFLVNQFFKLLKREIFSWAPVSLWQKRTMLEISNQNIRVHIQLIINVLNTIFDGKNWKKN